MFSLISFLFLLLLPTFSLFSNGVSHNVHPQSTHIPETSEEEGGYGVVSWGLRRSVLEGNNGDSTLVLAAERTRRKDPINHFKYYTGGWNISDEHYFYSVAYTGAPLFLIAAIWFVGCGLSLLLFCLCCCCCSRKSYGYSKTAYALSLILLSLFTVTAIIGCVVLYTGQGKFHNSTSDTLKYVLSQADVTAQNLRGVSKSLRAAKNVRVGPLSLPSGVREDIDDVDSAINSATTILESVTHENKNNIDEVLNAVSLALVIVAAVMLLVAFLGFLFSVLGFQSLVYFLVMIGWILVACTFILCGVFLVLHKVVGDTCVAMDEWVKNPTAHTALDDILPCVDNATAQETLSQSKVVTYLSVGIVNEIIANVSNRNLPPSAGSFYYNQSGPLVPLLCNPFNLNQSNRACAPGEVEFSNAKQIWKNYVCKTSGGICTTVGRLTPGMYDQMTNVVDVSFGLYHYGPFLISLLDCSFVRDTFTGIHNYHCPNLRQFSKWIYIGLAMVSAAVMLSLIFWILYARERRHRKYTKLAKSASVDDSFGREGP